MAGDRVQINTYSYYNTTTQQPAQGTNILTELLSILPGAVIGTSGGKLDAANSASLGSTLSPNVLQFLNNNPYDNSRPKAYLNWILFDEQYKYVASNSGVMQVQPGSEKQPMVAPEQLVSKNGYLFVYVSNESPQDVYFDDLTVRHITGPLVEEKSYYPFGLVLGAISSRAVLKAKTAYAYNAGSEWEENGIEYYHTFFRKYDAQIGRFTGVDIASEEYAGLTPFQFGANNPVLFNDPFGDRIPTLNDGIEDPNPNMAGLGNDLSWQRYRVDWSGLEEMERNWKSGGGGGYNSIFWSGLLNAFESSIDEGPMKSFVTDCIGNILIEGLDNTVFMINNDGSLSYIGLLGGILIVDKLLENLIAYNSGKATLAGMLNPIQFALWSMPNGVWDYKSNIKHIVGYAATIFDKEKNTQTCFNYKGLSMEAQDFGNVHYGVVGRSAMFSENQLLFAAGAVQIIFGYSKPKWRTPDMLKKYYGDDPRDQHWIKQGFKIYNSIFISHQFNFNWASWLLNSFKL